MEGLDKFREAFAEYSDNYVVIGGTACDIIMTNTIVRPRATHDIDMIVVVENMTPAFAERFWKFVLEEAGYHPGKRRQIEGESLKYELYRFINGKNGYPKMIELLSRHSDVLGEPKGLVIEPIPTDEYISDLSAIIMDDDFYDFTITHSIMTDGIRHADSVALIALKAKAYLNLLSDKNKGIQVDSRDIRKHRSDVFKLVAILENTPIDVPTPIVECIKEFVVSVKSEWSALSASLSQSLGQDVKFVADLLEQLNEMFITEE